MTVARLDLRVADTDRARRLLVDLLGGVPVAAGPDGGGDTDGAAGSGGAGGVVVDSVGGAVLACTGDDVDRAVLDRIVVAVEGAPDLGDTTDLLGTRVVTVPPGHAPTGEHEPRGLAWTRHLDHVCLAVRSLRDAVDLLTGVLGGSVVFGGHEHTNGTVSSQVDLGGGTRVELLEPTRPDAAVARFLDRGGPGMHHLTWKVADVVTARDAAEGAGFQTTGTDLDRRPHWRETYLRPRGALGMLVQLAWTTRSYTEPLDDGTVARIVRGEVDSFDYGMDL